jgi:hypothetical protein
VRKVKALGINTADVSYGSSGSTTGRRAKATRSSRASSVTSRQVTLEHRPTGVVVEGSVPSGSYSRVALQRLVAELRAKLLADLDNAVARKLRLPGR